MPDQDPTITELEARLDALVRTQVDFQKEISLIRSELVRLRARRIAADQRQDKASLYSPVERASRPAFSRPADPEAASPGSQPPMHENPPFRPSLDHESPPRIETPPRPSTGTRPPSRPQAAGPGYRPPRQAAHNPDPVLSSATVRSDAFARFVSQYTENARANMEKFIGENLISLIGIIVLVLGVGIGAKYAIDNNWISPLTRIIIGYVFAFGLAGLALKIKGKYHNFSAVLISGGMAAMYFLTYFAYSPYGLLSQLGAFGLMVMFTIFTVAAALIYSRQVIAHIGLVGAYAVPFLLSNDSGNYLALFVYVSIVNVGILAVSLKKNWVPIFYTSSIFTWLIFCGWFFTKYSPQDHFSLALVFLGVLFAILYGTKVAQSKLLGEDEDRTENLAASTFTAAVFYLMCFAVVMTGPLELFRYWIVFAYLAIASVVIIAASLKFYKHPSGFYASTFFIWGIFCAWFVTAYSYRTHFALALTFMGVFLAISYATTLVQAKLISDEDDRTANLAISILTGLAFYGLCFAVMMNHPMETPRYATLFTYIAAASVLILATSFRFFGRVFMYLVVPIVWAIYGTWFVNRYDASQHFSVAAIFATLFFAIFYFAILFHRLAKDNFSLIEHTSLILSNAFAFYGFGYSILDRDAELRDYLGLYTAAHAVLHLGVALAIRRIKSSAVDIVQVLTILILTFASIAVPVQFDGNVVTMVWAAEAAVLFWYGRSRAVSLFEYCSYPVMMLATGSLFLDWSVSYSDRISGLGPATPIFNNDFVTAVVFVAAFTLIYITNRNDRYRAAIGRELARLVGYAIAVAGTFVLYNMFRIEIGNYFHYKSVDIRSGGVGISTPTRPVGDMQSFNVITQINYSILFLIAMAAVNLKKLRSSTLALINSGLGVAALGVFATIGMFIFSDLRVAYVNGVFDGPVFIAPWMHFGIRPISYLFAFGLIYMLYQYSRDELLTDRISTRTSTLLFETIFYTFTFIVASCELVNVMGQMHIPEATKLGLSILWGIYALALVAIGIARGRKHLRIAAFVLLGVTLAKLFLYDIADLGTIPKTILFVTLGITLLVVSFLYNKYTAVMFKPDAIQED